ncbi:hypothetical protein ACSQ6I_17985 [Anabaena sp. WFMT]|uniref:hypothetical protein n=1 Tax=Anabaena sp. WFMT TaxID=3449730 RepID=UPI003F27734D
MTNPKNPNPDNREDKVTSYGDGFSDGRVSGTNLKNETLKVRDQNNAAGGLLIGIGITALLGLSGIAFYLWGRPPSNPVIVTPAPAAPQQPAKQTTIIERTNTVERVPVPVAVPAPPQNAPNINVKVDVPKSQAPREGKTDVNVIVPNNSQPATAPQNTTINVAPPESSTKVPTPQPTSSPDTSSNP